MNTKQKPKLSKFVLLGIVAVLVITAFLIFSANLPDETKRKITTFFKGDVYITSDTVITIKSSTTAVLHRKGKRGESLR